MPKGTVIRADRSRQEDASFQTHMATGTNDNAPFDEAHAVFARLDDVHGKIVTIEFTAAVAMPRALTFFTGEDFVEVGANPAGGLIKSRDGTLMKEPKRPARWAPTYSDAFLMDAQGLYHVTKLDLARGQANAANRAGIDADTAELGPETGKVTIEVFTAFDTFGTVISPMIVSGQAHGGCGQGIAQRLLARCVDNEDGRLTSVSCKDIEDETRRRPADLLRRPTPLYAL